MWRKRHERRERLGGLLRSYHRRVAQYFSVEYLQGTGTGSLQAKGPETRWTSRRSGQILSPSATVFPILTRKAFDWRSPPKLTHFYHFLACISNRQRYSNSRARIPESFTDRGVCSRGVRGEETGPAARGWTALQQEREGLVGAVAYDLVLVSSASKGVAEDSNRMCDRFKLDLFAYA